MAKKGIKFSEEHRKKLSKAKLGHKPWHKGKTGVYSKQTLEKMSKAKKGKKLSKEHIEKVSNALKGKKRPPFSKESRERLSKAIKKSHSRPEVKKKMSESHLGQTPWNKGKKASIETRKKLRNATLKTWKNPEYRKHMSDVHKGHKASEETKKKLRGRTPWNRGGKGLYKVSEETKKKLRGRTPWNKGTKGVLKPNSGSFKKGNIPWSKGKKGMWTAWNKGTKGVMKPNSGSFKKGQLAWSKGLTKETSEPIRKNAEKRKGRKNTPEQNKRLSERVKKLYSTGWSPRKGLHHSEVSKQKMRTAKIGKKLSEEHKVKLRKRRRHQIFPPKDTKPEKVLQEILQNNKIKFESHKPILGQPDIFIEPNICIFVDGDWFHGYKYMNGLDCSKNKVMNDQYFERVIERDKKKTRLLIKDGYMVLRLWEHEIMKEPEKCIQRILKVIKNNKDA